MPRGIKGSGKAAVAEVKDVSNVAQGVDEAKQDSISDPKPPAEKVRITPAEMRAMEAKAHLRDKAPKVLPPLEADQQYFEAPNGDLIVGMKSEERIWHRNLHGPGKGGFINPKR